ncbi:MAG: hypothetical protein V1719_00510, partial [Patescibacteria group bacterium]
MTTKGFAWLPLLIIIATVAVAGSVGYVIVSESINDNSNQTQNTNLVINNSNQAPNTNVDTLSECSSDNDCPSGMACDCTRIVYDCEYCEGGKCIFECVNSNTNVTGSTNSGVIDTSDWQTYTNDEYGFNFQHPSNITVYEGAKQYGEATFLSLTFIQDNQTLKYWFDVAPASGYTDPLIALTEVQSFDDLTNILTKKDDIQVGNETADHYCGVPGLISYCSAMLLNQQN